MDRLLLVLIGLFMLGTGAALADLPGLEVDVPQRFHTAWRDAAATADSPSDLGWRRTRHGWEHESVWRATSASLSPLHRISPIVIGMLQLLIAIGALVLFDRRLSERGRQHPESSVVRRV